MSVSLNGTNGLTFADSTTQNTGGYTGFRNRIINGDMRIDQRNAGAAVTAGGAYAVDRFIYLGNQASKFTLQQNAGSVTPPSGFINYLGATSSSAYSSLAGDFFWIDQRIEGLNCADLGFGTANAQAVTLSFWVRSSLAGTHSGFIQNSNSSRSYVFTFTVNSANTWEQKTVSIAGDTSGSWLTTNGTGIFVGWNLGVGSNWQTSTTNAWQSAQKYGATGSQSIVGTSGATFYITGVQLEKGSVATPFEFRPYGTELQLCQRYYIQYGPNASGNNKIGSGVVVGVASATLSFPAQTMRAVPTVSFNANTQLYDGSVVPTITSVDSVGLFGPSVSVQFTASGGGLSTGKGVMVRVDPSLGYISFSSEL